MNVETTSENLLSESESYQKNLVSKYVGPILTIMSILYYAAFLQFRADLVLIMIFGFLVTGMNIFFTVKNRSVRLGSFSFETKSDSASIMRWLFNLAIADVILIEAFNPGLVGIFGFWSLILLSAHADMHRRKYKKIVQCVGIVIGSILLVRNNPEGRILENVFYCYCLLAIVMIFNAAEKYWLDEIEMRQKSETKFKDLTVKSEYVQAQMDQLEIQVKLADQLRTIAHETNNCLTILNGAIYHEKPDLSMIRRAVDKVNKINLLVLEGISSNRQRTYKVSELVEDCESLLSKVAQGKGSVDWKLNASQDAINCSYSERTGSVFFILMNLVKNSSEAIARSGKNGTIILDIDIRNGSLVIKVRDSGPGIPEHIIQAIVKQERYEYSEAGHGIGMRFCVQECKKNEFAFEIQSFPGEGTTSSVTIPVHQDSLSRKS